MAISPLGIMDHASPQVMRVLNGTTLETTQLGAALAVGAESPSLGARMRRNRFCVFERNLYVWHDQDIYQFNFGAKTWASVKTLSFAPNTNPDGRGGLYLLEDNSGDLMMVAIYQRSSNVNWYVTTSTDGTTWTADAAILNTGGGGAPVFGCPYQGRLWFATTVQTNHKVVSYDPVSGSVVSYTWPSTIYSGGPGTSQNVTNNAQLLVFQGRLFWIGTDLSGGNSRLMTMLELVGGGFATVPISGGTDPGLTTSLYASPSGAVGAFEYQGNMYVVWWNPTNSPPGTLGQMRCVQFVPNVSAVGGSFQENDVSSVVIPAAWRPGGAFENLGSASSCVYVHVDVTSPGGPQPFWWRQDAIGSGSSTFWTFNGPAVLATVVNSNVGSQHSLPKQFNSTGERIYTEGDYDVELDSTETEPSRIAFEFQVFLPLDGSTPSAKQGRLWYSVGGSDWQQATFTADAPVLVSGVGPAPTISGNLLQNVLVNGDRIQAWWDAPADGFSTAGLDFELLLEVF